MVAAQHRPRGEQHEQPRQQRQVGVPRLREEDLPVAPDGECEQDSDDGDAFQPRRRWPIQSAVAMAARWITTVAASRAHDDEPRMRYVGASR